MVLEIIELTELIRNEFVAHNLFSHVISAHVSFVHLAAASTTGPENVIDWSHGQEDKKVKKVENQVDVKVGRTRWYQHTNLKLAFFF